MNKSKGILGNKIYLYLTEFFSGMAVMAVELGASRLLAPYFSSSQIVWTIIIGTIMIAMALGNIFGGKWADKDPNPDRLYKRILIAAIWIAAIPVLGKYVIAGVSALLIFTVNTGFLVIAAFVSCMVVFVFPLFLLGTVTPSLVKYTTENLEENGKVVGMLGAVNTIGSILGTFLPTFVTIPSVGTAISFLLFAGILLFLAILYFISTHSRKKTVVVSVVLFVLCCVFGHDSSFAFWESDITYEGESVYNYLQVKEDQRRVALSTNVLFGVQSVRMKQEELTGLYYDYALAAPYMAGLPEKKEGRVLILGNGTGTYLTQCRNYFDNLSAEGVEIDEKITGLAYEYFDLPDDAKVSTYDGRAYLNASEETYDVIMVDAYQDITIPFQMSSIDFFSQVRDHLSENGVMVVNMNMRGTKEGSITDYLSDTISRVFPEVYTVDVFGSTNRELFASNNPAMLTDFVSSYEKETRPDLKAMMELVEAGLTPYEGGDRILTDDKAPVELLGMMVIDDLIRDEVSYYKEIYEEKGFSGLLEAF